MNEQRVVIAKHANSVNSFLLHGQPHKLLLVSMGNISTSELIRFVSAVSAATLEAVCSSFLFRTVAYAASYALVKRNGSILTAPGALGLLVVSGSPGAAPAVPPA